MTLARYLKALRRMWPLVVLAAVIGLLLGFGSALIMPKSYEAQTTIFVNVSDSATVQDLQMGEQFAQSRAASYAAIGTSSEVLEPVVDELGPGATPESITVTNSPNTATLSVTATDADPERAAQMASAASTSLVEAAARLEGASSPEESPVQLSIVDDARVPESPAAPSMSMNIMVGAVAGLVVGLLIVLARAASATRAPRS